MSKNKVILLVWILSLFTSVYGKWKENVLMIDQSYKNEHAYVLDDMAVKENIYLLWAKSNGDCKLSYDSRGFFANFQNSLLKNIRQVPFDQVIYDQKILLNNNELEIIWSSGPSPLASKYLYYVKYNITNDTFSNFGMVYSGGSNIQFAVPLKIYKNNKNERFIFFRLDVGSFMNPQSISINYLVNKGAVWEGPYKVPIAPDFINGSPAWAEDENGNLHLVVVSGSQVNTIYSKFDGISWSPIEYIPKANNQYPYSPYYVNISIWNNCPYILITNRNDNERRDGCYITYKSNSNWINPIKLEDSLYPQDLVNESDMYLFDPSICVDSNNIVHFIAGVKNGLERGILYGRFQNGQWSKIIYSSKLREDAYQNYMDYYNPLRLFIDNNNSPNIIYANRVFNANFIWEYSYMSNLYYSFILPPINVNISHQENNTIFQREYFDLISWAKNSENDDQEIAYYNIYIKESTDDSFRFLVQLSSNTFSYTIRNLKDKNSQYAISTIDIYGNESELLYSN